MRKNFLEKYGIGEYILFIVGLTFLIRVGHNVIVLDFEKLTFEAVGVLVLFLCLGVVLLIKPMYILDLARKRLGLEPKIKKTSSNSISKNGGGAVTPNKGF